MADDKPVGGMTAEQMRRVGAYGPSGLGTFWEDLETNRAPLLAALREQRLGSYLVDEGEKIWDALPKPWNNPDTTLAVLDTAALPAKAAVGMAKGIGSIIKEAVTDPTPETAADAALLVAGLGGGLSALGVGAKQARSLSMFVGRNAENADLSKLATAEKMAAKGHSREEIHDQTGWFRWQRPIVGPHGKRVIGPDGKRVTEPISDWMFEISDADSYGYVNPEVLTPTGRLKKGTGGVFPLGKIFEHPELAKAYTGRPPSAVSVPAPAPASGAPSSGAAIAAIMKQRLELSAELKALKGSGLDVKEYEAAYQKLQARDKELLDEYIVEYNKDKASVKETELEPVETPASAGSATSPPEWTETDFEFGNSFIDTSKLERPILEIEGSKEKGDSYGAAYFPDTDRMSFGTLPGNAPRDTWVKWDRQPEKGVLVQKLNISDRGRDVLAKNLKDAQKVFKKAGVSLDTAGDFFGSDAPVHSLRYWKTDRKLSKEEQARLFETTPEAEEAWRLVHQRENTFYEKDDLALTRFRGSALHELQHAIQRREGWQTGANWKNYGKAGPPRYKKKLKDPFTGERLTNVEKYYRTLGEIAARVTASRKDLTDAQRLERRPWTREGGLDRLESQAILEKDFKAAGGPVYGSNIQHMADGGPPKLRRDNPGGEWLAEKIRGAGETRQEYRDKGRLDSIYATVGGTEGVTGWGTYRLNPQDLIGIKGAMREERTIPGEKLRRLKKSISEKGYSPDSILMVVREDGVPFVTEGNNRLAEAIESGRPSIEVELKYLRGAEDVAGRISPDKLSSMIVEAPEATAKDPSNLPALIAKTAALSLPDEPPPKGQTGKGQLFRGIGALMRRRIFPLIQAAQLGYEHLLSEEQKAEVEKFLSGSVHESLGMEKPGIEYFKDLFGMSEDSPRPTATPASEAASALDGLETFPEIDAVEDSDPVHQLSEPELEGLQRAFDEAAGGDGVLGSISIREAIDVENALQNIVLAPNGRMYIIGDALAHEGFADLMAEKAGINFAGKLRPTRVGDLPSTAMQTVLNKLNLTAVRTSLDKNLSVAVDIYGTPTSRQVKAINQIERLAKRGYGGRPGTYHATYAARAGAELPMDQASRMARSEEMGFDVDLYHGSRAMGDEGVHISGEFDDRGLGVHFGTSEQASNRLRQTRRERGLEGENLLPLKVRIKNPIELPDAGEHDNPLVVAEAYLKTDFGRRNQDALSEILSEAEDLAPQFEDIDAWKASPEAEELLQDIQRLIIDEGHDSIRYRNVVENQYGDLTGFTREGQQQYDTLNKEYHELRKTIAQRDAPPPELGATAEEVLAWVDRGQPKATAAEATRFDEIAAATKRLEGTSRNSPYSYILFDTKNIRSRFAKFDPAKKDRAGLDFAAGGFVDKPLYDNNATVGL